jgi:hypothetical protein
MKKWYFVSWELAINSESIVNRELAIELKVIFSIENKINNEKKSERVYRENIKPYHAMVKTHIFTFAVILTIATLTETKS